MCFKIRCDRTRNFTVYVAIFPDLLCVFFSQVIEYSVFGIWDIDHRAILKCLPFSDSIFSLLKAKSVFQIKRIACKHTSKV